MANSQPGNLFVFTKEPYGTHPIQAEGLIPATNQAFYFRYRVGKARLLVSYSNEVVYSFDPDRVGQLALICQAEVDPRRELSREEIVQFITDCVREHLATFGAPGVTDAV